MRSPSGHLLSPEVVLTREDRPLSIRERQERIKERVQQESRLGVEVIAEPEAEVEVEQKRDRKGSCCSQ